MHRFPKGRLLVFAKAPVPGRAKTRLIPALGPQGAADLHRRLTVRTLDLVSDAGLAPVELWCSPGAGDPVLKELAAGRELRLRSQRGGDLGERMHGAFAECRADTDYAVVIGTDCPAMDAGYLARAFEALEEGADAVLGPAEDGGYVLLGLRRMDRSLFAGIPWGTAGVLAETRQRLKSLGWSWRELDVLWDVDRPGDLEKLRYLPDVSGDV